MRDKFFLLVGIALIVWSFYMVLQDPAPTKYQELPLMHIGNQTIRVEIADTDMERIRGLSGRESLSSGTGLLFIFDRADYHGIWMKDMNFPIDIVWLEVPRQAGESYRVVDIEKNVSPSTFPHVFYPPRPVKYILETNPGELN
jgi:uncharacterized membrane protein (UPF0127 family)